MGTALGPVLFRTLVKVVDYPIMVGSLLNLRKRTVTSSCPPPTPKTPVRAVSSSEWRVRLKTLWTPGVAKLSQSRPARTVSRLSRVGLSVGASRKASPDTDSSVVDLNGLSPTLTDTSIGSGRPWKQFRRQSKSFSSVFTSRWFPHTPPAAPATDLTPPTSSAASSASLSGLQPRPRFASERKKKRLPDGLKHQISYPLLMRESLDNQTGRKSWGARDESQKAPMPTTATWSGPYASERKSRPGLNELGTFAAPPSSRSFLICAASPAAVCGVSQTGPNPSPVSNPIDESRPLSTRASNSSLGSVYSTVTGSSFAWVDFPSTMTMSVAAPKPSMFSGPQSDPATVTPDFDSDPFRRTCDQSDVFTAAPVTETCPFPTSTVTKAGREPDSPAAAVARRVLSWTSKDPGASADLPVTLQAKRTLPYGQSMPDEHFLTPPPTPRAHSTFLDLANDDSELALSELALPVQTREISATHADEGDQDSPTRDSLLSQTLAELSDEMAALRRTQTVER